MRQEEAEASTTAKFIAKNPHFYKVNFVFTLRLKIINLGLHNP
tara:strand:- start:244 stop:372 length:129 start_codon:yes stop_codon:yes gene_type:complete